MPIIYIWLLLLMLLNTLSGMELEVVNVRNFHVEGGTQIYSSVGKKKYDRISMPLFPLKRKQVFQTHNNLLLCFHDIIFMLFT